MEWIVMEWIIVGAFLALLILPAINIQQDLYKRFVLKHIRIRCNIGYVEWIPNTTLAFMMPEEATSGWLFENNCIQGEISNSIDIDLEWDKTITVYPKPLKLCDLTKGKKYYIAQHSIAEEIKKVETQIIPNKNYIRGWHIHVIC